MQKFHSSVVIIGGGIAGCWLFRRLRDAGVQALLIEKAALGTGQTISSQGMIHGGQRYATQGKATKHSQGIAEMPAVWDACLRGKGEVDISSARVLSEDQIMWSAGGVASGVMSFFAGKSMRAKVDKVEKSDFKKPFNNKTFSGKVYKMDEQVLEVASTLSSLVEPYKEDVYQAEITAFNCEGEGLKTLTLNDGVELRADQFIFTAGEGNEMALEALGQMPENESQRRPLHQVLVKGDLPEVYGHCLAVDYEPRFTVTTHKTQQGENVWYLGGRVSTRTTDLSKEQTILNAKSELEDVFPWMDWQNKEWSTVYVNRAEPKYIAKFSGGKTVNALGDGPVIKTYGNTHICWPTKLTFTPDFVQLALERLGEVKQDKTPVLPFPHPEVARYPWDEAEWVSL